MSSQDYFNEVAGCWDQMRENFFPEAVREKIIATAGVGPGHTAADVGAGTGFVTEALVQRGVHVIAIDYAREMIRQLDVKFRAGGFVDCRPGESESLPVEDNAVDAVTANMYLHHVENPPQAILEMARILKPGGKLVIADLDEHDFAFLQTEQKDRWRGFCRDHIRRWFWDAGLRDVSVEDVGRHCCASSEQGCTKAQISIFIAAGVKAV